MIQNEKQMLMRVVEHFLTTGNAEDGQVKVIRLADNKTSFVEYMDKDSRSIMLDEFIQGSRRIWAGFSSRSQTVYLSATG